MSVYIDRKYALLTSPKLQLFKQKKEFLWNFRCPICMDSKKDKLKARGYFYRQKFALSFMCHNCGASMSFGRFLKQFDPHLYQEYQMECYKDNNSGPKVDKPDLTIFTSQPTFAKKDKIDLPDIASLPDDHEAKRYLLGRKIPEDRLKELYYAENFLEFAKEYFPVEKKIPSDQRIVIPFFDIDNTLMGVQGRALLDTGIRYITLKAAEGYRKIFGLHRINFSETIYVVEGPFDSMFLPNCIATMDSSLYGVNDTVGFHKYVLVFDNQPRNKEICKQIQRAIKMNMHVVLWPEHIDEKDINDMIKAGMTKEKVLSIIKENTFHTLAAQLKFNLWKKV